MDIFSKDRPAAGPSRFSHVSVHCPRLRRLLLVVDRLDDLRQIDALTGSALGTAQRLAGEISNAPARALCPQLAQRMTIRLVIVAFASAAADRALTVA